MNTYDELIYCLHDKINNNDGVENKRLTSFEENEENLKMWDNLIGKFKKVENDNDLDKWMKLLASEMKKLPMID